MVNDFVYAALLVFISCKEEKGQPCNDNWCHVHEKLDSIITLLNKEKIHDTIYIGGAGVSGSSQYGIGKR